jgi:hypothetical protein
VLDDVVLAEAAAKMREELALAEQENRAKITVFLPVILTNEE